MPKVNFHSADRSLSLKGKTAIKEFIAFLFEEEEKALSRLNYIFCSDEYLLTINQQHLKHDYYTDIITFDLTEKGGIEGEVYVSVDRVRENSAELGVSYRAEILRVLFHGALHLCGYKDKKKSELTKMRNREDYYLRLFGKKSNGSF